ncbi:MAG TPA: hypothetical protein VM261_20675 [Kofleriaceae bacterium]|nr:hypothetical protein [Kofleriaceae bacterium]
MRRIREGFALSLIVAVAMLFGAACGSNSGDDDGNNDGDGGVDDGDGGFVDDGDAATTPPGECVTGPSQCTDGLDNDNDNMTDLGDVECTSACDNDEGSFGTGQPGDNRDPNWQDCFFDGNSGAGNDGCRYNTCCLFPAGHPSACTQQQINQGYCDVTQECVDTCAPAAPPGCDCFGCCKICGVTGACADSAGCVQVVILPGCNFEDVCSDTVNCPPCQQSGECTTQCPTGTAECSVDGDCGNAMFCTDGCCVAQIP